MLAARIPTDGASASAATAQWEPFSTNRQEQGFLVPRGQLGALERRTHARIPRDVARDIEHLAPNRQRILLSREREHRFGVGTRNGDLFCHGAALQLLLEFGQEVRMCLGIDLAPEDPRRGRDRKIGDLMA